MSSRAWIIFLVILLIGSNAYLVYNTIDFGVSHTYLEASMEDASKRAEQAVRLANLNLIGLDIAQARRLIGKDVYDLEPFEKEGCLWVGQICLKLDDENRIVSIGRGDL